MSLKGFNIYAVYVLELSSLIFMGCLVNQFCTTKHISLLSAEAVLNSL